MQKILIALTALLIMSGCQTAAQKQQLVLENGLKAGLIRFKTCVENVAAKSEHGDILKKFPLDPHLNPSISQLADSSFIKDEEIPKILSFYNDTLVCRKIRIDAISNIAPSAVQLFSENDTTIDSLTVDLIQKKINWGDYNKKRTDIKNQSIAKAGDEGERIQNKLDLSHQAELESHQRVLQAIIARVANGSGYDYRQGMRDSQAFTNNAMNQHNNMVDQQRRNSQDFTNNYYRMIEQQKQDPSYNCYTYGSYTRCNPQ